MKKNIFPALILFVFLLTASVFAQSKVMTQEQILERGETLLAQGQTTEAIEFLKSGLNEFSFSGPISRLLAKAYLQQGNTPWALRTLYAHAEKTGDCETSTWIAMIRIRAGETEEAQAALDHGKCGGDDSAATRAKLIQSMLVSLNEDPQAAKNKLEEARKGDRRFPEDDELFGFVERMADPGRITPVRLGAKAAFGYTSNALQSSVAEDRGDSVDSFTHKLEADLDFVWPLSTYFRPEFRLDGKLQDFDDRQARDVGYRQFGGSAGFLLGNLYPRAGLFYTNDNLLINGGDDYDAGPRWFYETHRGDVEFEPFSWLMLFGGGGKRWFRERARTRYEGDFGAAGTALLPKGVSLSLALSGRMYDAQIEGYDQQGGSALLMARFPYYKDGSISLGALGSMDQYQNSEDYFEAGETRSDRLARAMIYVWTPSLWGLQYGLTYKGTQRDSTVEDYTYTAHEAFFVLSWRGGFDPFRPLAQKQDLHVTFDYGLSQNTLAQQRIQDLLREEDAARQSSSCAD